MQKLFIVAACSLALPVHAEPIYAETYHYTNHYTRAGGWFWYQDPAPVAPQETVPEVAEDGELELQQPGNLMPKAGDYQQQLELFQEKVQQALAKAVLQPDPQNLQNYMQLNAQSLALAGQFADTWQWVLQQQPQLDYRLQYPADDQAVQVVNYYNATDRDSKLQQLSTEYGLWFMFRGDCPVCHRFAPVLREFADSYGFSVIAVSMDGGVLPDFPGARTDNGIADSLEVDLVPALFLVAPKEESFKGIGYGYMSAATLRQKILLASEGEKLYGKGNDVY